MSSEFRLLVLSSPHFRAAFHLCGWFSRFSPFYGFRCTSPLTFLPNARHCLSILACFQIRFLRFFFRTFREFMRLLTLFPLLYLSGPTRLSRQFDVACNQGALSTESFYSDLILDGCFSSENSPLGFVRSIWCARSPALALDLGHCTLFLVPMPYNFLKRILLVTLGVEYSS